MHPIQEIVVQQKRGIPRGIHAICSANAYVLKAALARGMRHHTPVLIESTANQVDQYGGYSGMKPSEFYAFVEQLVAESGIDPALVILGGDHLGPLTFSKLPEAAAMAEASELVRQYVAAGFTKIHLDTSMRLGDDDPSAALTDEVIARRGALLCAVAENAYEQRRSSAPDAQPPVYVIGSEVPIPGGAQENEAGISVTSPEACRQTIEAFRAAFAQRKLDDAWQRVVGVVVQPGVEFGDAHVDVYDRQKAAALTGVLRDFPGMVFEGHSTDYQTKHALKQMVEDGIAILKVGPALTFALREGLLALESIEREIWGKRDVFLSNFRNILETAMLDRPAHWQHHYHGTGNDQRFARVFSYSDRARYYLNVPAVQDAIARLLHNLRAADIPPTAISQYMPVQYEAVQQGRLSRDPASLLADRVGNCMDTYLYATGALTPDE